MRFMHLIALLGTLSIASARAGSVNIAECGASGDGKTINTRTIQHAIDSCAAAGGGTVVVPRGVFLTGTLRLRSNIRLAVEAGGVLKGSTRLEDYMSEGKLLGLLYTEDAVNVTVTGPGSIDGSGDAFMDTLHAKNIENAGTSFTRQKEHFREVAAGLGDGPVVPLRRPFQMIIFSSCRNVVVRDLLITNSPFWTVHCADCDGVLLTAVRIWCSLLVPNNDGADFTSCSNVLVSDCDIRTGDDCLVFTGYCRHFDLPGYRGLRHPSENISVTNCTLVSRSSAVRIGGFDQNPMRNYTFSNLTIHDSNRGIGIFARDEGSIENMVFTGIVIDTRLHTGDWWGNGEPIHVSALRLTKGVTLGCIANIRFRDVICTGESGIVVYGSPESVIENIAFEGLSLRVRKSPLGAVAGGNFDMRPVQDESLQLFAHDIPAIFAQDVRGLTIRDVTVAWDAVTEPFFTNGIEVHRFDGLVIEGFRGTGAPAHPGAFPVLLRDGKGYSGDVSPGRISAGNVGK